MHNIIKHMVITFLLAASTVLYATGNTGDAGLDAEKSGSSDTPADNTDKAEQLDSKNNYEKTQQTTEVIKKKPIENRSEDTNSGK